MRNKGERLEKWGERDLKVEEHRNDDVDGKAAVSLFLPPPLLLLRRNASLSATEGGCAGRGARSRTRADARCRWRGSGGAEREGMSSSKDDEKKNKK